MFGGGYFRFRTPIARTYTQMIHQVFSISHKSEKRSLSPTTNRFDGVWRQMARGSLAGVPVEWVPGRAQNAKRSADRKTSGTPPTRCSIDRQREPPQVGRRSSRVTASDARLRCGAGGLFVAVVMREPTLERR